MSKVEMHNTETKKLIDWTIADSTMALVREYLNKLKENPNIAGGNLRKLLQADKLNELTSQELLRLIISTKTPKAFGEEELRTPNNVNYSQDELRILARTGAVMLTRVYNDGDWNPSKAEHYPEGKPCTMGFVSAPLLKNGSPDLAEVTNEKGDLDPEKYSTVMTERLLPVLKAMSDSAKSRSKKLAITLPGLGCSSFAGDYKGKVQYHLQNCLKQMLTEHADQLDGIDRILFDAYSIGNPPVTLEEEPDVKTDAKTKLYTIARASIVDGGKPTIKDRKQLTLPNQATDADGIEIEMGTVVAADLLSFPANDAWVSSRYTDEGVKGASSYITAQIAEGLLPEEDKKIAQERGAFKYNMRAGSLNMVADEKTTDEIVKKMGFDVKVNTYSDPDTGERWEERMHLLKTDHKGLRIGDSVVSKLVEVKVSPVASLESKVKDEEKQLDRVASSSNDRSATLTDKSAASVTATAAPLSKTNNYAIVSKKLNDHYKGGAMSRIKHFSHIQRPWLTPLQKAKANLCEDLESLLKRLESNPDGAAHGALTKVFGTVGFAREQYGCLQKAGVDSMPEISVMPGIFDESAEAPSIAPLAAGR